MFRVIGACKGTSLNSPSYLHGAVLLTVSVLLRYLTQDNNRKDVYQSILTETADVKLGQRIRIYILLIINLLLEI